MKRALPLAIAEAPKLVDKSIAPLSPYASPVIARAPEAPRKKPVRSQCQIGAVATLLVILALALLITPSHAAPALNRTVKEWAGSFWSTQMNGSAVHDEVRQLRTDLSWELFSARNYYAEITTDEAGECDHDLWTEEHVKGINRNLTLFKVPKAISPLRLKIGGLAYTRNFTDRMMSAYSSYVCPACNETLFGRLGAYWEAATDAFNEFTNSTSWLNSMRSKIDVGVEAVKNYTEYEQRKREVQACLSAFVEASVLTSRLHAARDAMVAEGTSFRLRERYRQFITQTLDNLRELDEDLEELALFEAPPTRPIPDPERGINFTVGENTYEFVANPYGVPTAVFSKPVQVTYESATNVTCRFKLDRDLLDPDMVIVESVVCLKGFHREEVLTLVQEHATAGFHDYDAWMPLLSAMHGRWTVEAINLKVSELCVANYDDCVAHWKARYAATIHAAKVKQAQAKASDNVFYRLATIGGRLFHRIFRSIVRLEIVEQNHALGLRTVFEKMLYGAFVVALMAFVTRGNVAIVYATVIYAVVQCAFAQPIPVIEEVPVPYDDSFGSILADAWGIAGELLSWAWWLINLSPYIMYLVLGLVVFAVLRVIWGQFTLPIPSLR